MSMKLFSAIWTHRLSNPLWWNSSRGPATCALLMLGSDHSAANGGGNFGTRHECVTTEGMTGGADSEDWMWYGDIRLQVHISLKTVKVSFERLWAHVTGSVGRDAACSRAPVHGLPCQTSPAGSGSERFCVFRQIKKLRIITVKILESVQLFL